MIEVLEREFNEIDEDSEERYVITPKGIANICMLQCGLIRDLNDSRFEGFWRMFEEDMKKCGYVNFEEDSNE